MFSCWESVPELLPGCGVTLVARDRVPVLLPSGGLVGGVTNYVSWLGKSAGKECTPSQLAGLALPAWE